VVRLSHLLLDLEVARRAQTLDDEADPGVTRLAGLCIVPTTAEPNSSTACSTTSR